MHILVILHLLTSNYYFSQVKFVSQNSSCCGATRQQPHQIVRLGRKPSTSPTTARPFGTTQEENFTQSVTVSLCLKGHSRIVTCSAWSPEGVLYTGGFDGNVCLSFVPVLLRVHPFIKYKSDIWLEVRGATAIITRVAFSRCIYEKQRKKHTQQKRQAHEEKKKKKRNADKQREH